MTAYELFLKTTMPLKPAIYRIFRDLYEKEGKYLHGNNARILDIGGRNSHYTAGFDSKITISDLPRESKVQEQLKLGLTDSIEDNLKRRRSNIEKVVYDDMTVTQIPDNSYDMALAVEVIEHVPNDDAFVKNIAKVLKPGSKFLLTTPNGETLTVINNPDHQRHYTAAQLHSLLAKYFADVRVEYAVPKTDAHLASLGIWKPKQPAATLRAMQGGLASYRENGQDHLRIATNTIHLVAVAANPIK